MAFSPRISVVIPVLNEARRITAQLNKLRQLELHEVIVVDGGSTDETPHLVSDSGFARLVMSRRGRGIQMNRGAEAASGDVILFLHADVTLPDNAVSWIVAALQDRVVVAGAFRTWTIAEEGHNWLSPLLHLADIRSRYTSLPYGDQALFVRADVFRQLNGFPESQLMEDLELSRRLRKRGKIKTVRASVTVSGRRFLARPAYYALLMNLFPLLYRMGVSPDVLAGFYGDPR